MVIQVCSSHRLVTLVFNWYSFLGLCLFGGLTSWGFVVWCASVDRLPNKHRAPVSVNQMYGDAHHGSDCLSVQSESPSGPAENVYLIRPCISSRNDGKSNKADIPRLPEPAKHSFTNSVTWKLGS